MPTQPRSQQRLHFVGDETLDWVSNTKTGPRTWKYRQPIDNQKVDIGSEIAIMRYHPLHQDSLDSHLGNRTTRPQAVLLLGKVLGVRKIKNGIVTFTTTNMINGGLTAVDIPITSTTINPDGGWLTKAIPLRSRGGLALRYRTWISARDPKMPRA